MNLQEAIDTLTDGDELRLMTRHNAADFVHATAVVVKAVNPIADGREMEWCKVHDSKAATPLVDMGRMRVGMCQRYSLLPSEGLERCVFELKLLIDSPGDTNPQ